MEKKKKKNFTFNLHPDTQELLLLIAQRKDRSQSKTLDILIKEKAKQLKVGEYA